MRNQHLKQILRYELNNNNTFSHLGIYDLYFGAKFSEKLCKKSVLFYCLG
jgi:hypothetical protein